MGIAKDFAAKLYFKEELAELEALRAEKLASVEVTEEVIEEPAKAKFGDITDIEGNIWYFEGDDLTVGAKLYSDEGLSEEVDATAEVTLENGDVISIEGGFVIAITPAEAPIEEEQAAEPTSIKETTTVETNFQEEVQPEVSVVEELLTALTPKFESYDAQFATINEALGLANEANEELTKANEELKEELTATKEKAEKFAKLPAAESHKVTKPVSKSDFKRYNGGSLAGKNGFRKI